MANIFQIEEGSQSLSSSFTFTTVTNIDWRCSVIGINLSTAVSRTINVYITDGTTDFLVLTKTAYSGQNIIITDKIELNRSQEIKITADATSGTLKYFVVKEVI